MACLYHKTVYKLSDVHNYVTRSYYVNYFINESKSNLRKFFIANNGIVEWNSLPIDIKLCNSLVLFKRLVTKYISSQ
jgi:hypothetical protein